MKKNKSSNFVIVDGRVTEGMVNTLEQFKIKVVKTPCCKELYHAISYHPDIMIHPIDRKNVVIAPNVYSLLEDVFIQNGINPIKGDTFLKSNYPDNIAYNVARVSKFAIHNFKYTDKAILKLLEKNGIRFIHVKQGYSKCSTCIVNEHAIITADRGIAKEVVKYGIDVLLISSGSIDLPGLEYGFIGGASGLIGKNKLFITGQLNKHPDYNSILEFLKKNKVKPIFLNREKPIDLGSILFFDNGI
ncbi:hypothetical protein IZY60_11635 [Lutibacter sp. B2]|nr:hypothetical protein [Lutibacter sp. B2]